jgi:hypothetical protein
MIVDSKVCILILDYTAKGNNQESQYTKFSVAMYDQDLGHAKI